MALHLKKNKKGILESWMEIQMADVSLREDLLSNEELRQQSDQLLSSLLEIIDNPEIESIDDEKFAPVLEILASLSIDRARQGFSPRETGLFVFGMKDSLVKYLQKDLKNNPNEMVEQTLRISKIIDSLGIFTFENFIKGREQVIQRQMTEIDELSTPVIQVWDGVLALPIIGTLDSARTQVVMENLLQMIVSTGSVIAILDISGVPAVDSLVAQHLIKTVSATRLMGAECIISGIRPEIAQTIVHLGIDLSGIITKASLESALRFAFGILKYEIKKTR